MLPFTQPSLLTKGWAREHLRLPILVGPCGTSQQSLREGCWEEIFVPYRGNFKLEREMVDDERDGWVVFGKRFLRDMG